MVKHPEMFAHRCAGFVRAGVPFLAYWHRHGQGFLRLVDASDPLRVKTPKKTTVSGFRRLLARLYKTRGVYDLVTVEFDGTNEPSVLDMSPSGFVAEYLATTPICKKD